MRIVFNVEDEKTVTNDTVKVFVDVAGPAGTNSRSVLEKQAREALEEFLPGSSWAFAGYEVSRSQGVPIFKITGTTRIPAEQNDDLTARARDCSEDSAVVISVLRIEQNVPNHLLRDGYAAIRANVIQLAKVEVDGLKAEYHLPDLRILDVDFSESVDRPSASGKFSTSNSYSAAGASSDTIGYSEKISIKAKVTLTDGKDEDRPQVVVNY